MYVTLPPTHSYSKQMTHSVTGHQSLVNFPNEAQTWRPSRLALIITSGRIDAQWETALGGSPKTSEWEETPIRAIFPFTKWIHREKIKRGNRPTREKMTWNAVGGKKKHIPKKDGSGDGMCEGRGQETTRGERPKASWYNDGRKHGQTSEQSQRRHNENVARQDQRQG